MKTPPINNACFVCFCTALTGFTFLFIFSYRQLAEQREWDWLFIPASLRPAIWEESHQVVFSPLTAVLALFSLMCVWEKFWAVCFKITFNFIIPVFKLSVHFNFFPDHILRFQILLSKGIYISLPLACLSHS